MKIGRPSANGKETTLEQLTTGRQEELKRMNIEIPISLHSAFKSLAAKRNSSIKIELKKLIEQEIANESND